MDPMAIGAVLAAIAGGVGEGLGGQLWDGVCDRALRSIIIHRRTPLPATMGTS